MLRVQIVFLASNLQKIIDFKEINSASERQFNNVIAAVEKVLEDHRLQIEDLYSSVRICPSGSLRFGPQVTLAQGPWVTSKSYNMSHII